MSHTSVILTRTNNRFGIISTYRENILKDFKNAQPAKMLIYVENWIFSLCEK